MNRRFTSEEIREVFLRFFEEKDHLRVPGASLVPDNDPSLLYINSGMAPMKRYFTGEAQPPRPDLCNVQPCIRTRDIDDVGDRHHLTFFEMLGSWSIDHYFKERAIELAYELLVERFGLPPERLYATVYRGNKAIDLPPDEVSARAWEAVGLTRGQIVFLGEDNFWGPAGDHGPCGPCTEVFYDTGSEFGEAYREGAEFDSKSRYIEIWNAGVFMEFNKLPDGSFKKLRFNSVDTGSGVERMTMTLNGHATVYETDVFRPILDIVEQQLGSDRSSEADRRIIADHLRAATFILAEGVAPSNEGRGYIPRRLIRKAVAIAVRAGVPDFDFVAIIDAVILKLGPHYPVLTQNKDRAIEAFVREDQDFERVIQKGLARLESLCAKPPFSVSGADVFALFSTYGMPTELVRDIVRERGGAIDEAGYQAEFKKHQEISRAVPTGAGGDGASPWPESRQHLEALAEQVAPTEFLGYENSSGAARVVALFVRGAPVERAGNGQHVEVVTDRTPFYAEGGGQVGDRGVIAADGAVRAEVLDTQAEAGITAHRARVVEGELQVGHDLRLEVDADHRRRVVLNHSATHLMHAALRRVLGEHVKQKGSLVEADRLRFDFQHPGKMTRQEIAAVERDVNGNIRRNLPKTTDLTTYDDALKKGALAFFGENYGDEVRLVRFGDASAELCGGTHVGATGEIGLFRVQSEGSIQSGVRRIVAITGEAALETTLEHERVLHDVAHKLKVGVPDLLERVDKLLAAAQARAVKAAEAPLEKIDVDSRVKALPGGLCYVGAFLQGSADEVRDEAQRVAKAIGGVACLVGRDDGKARIVIAVDKVAAPSCDARKLMRELAPLIGGRGGGKPLLAQGGGGRVEGLQDVLDRLPAVLESAGG